MVKSQLKANEVPKDHPMRELSGVHKGLSVVESDIGELLYAQN